VSSVSVKFQGLKELDRAINKLPQELQRKAYRSVLSTGARVIAKNAKRHVTVDSGNLKKAIGIKVNAKRGTPVAIIGVKRVTSVNINSKKKTAVNYAKNVEQGTAHTEARPFIRPAVDESANEVLSKMAHGLNRFMDRAVKKLKTKGKF